MAHDDVQPETTEAVFRADYKGILKSSKDENKPRHGGQQKTDGARRRGQSSGGQKKR